MIQLRRFCVANVGQDFAVNQRTNAFDWVSAVGNENKKSCLLLTTDAIVPSPSAYGKIKC